LAAILIAGVVKSLNKMKNKIEERLETYNEWKEEIFTNIKNSKNITSGRVIKWADDLQKLEVKIGELEALLV